MTAFGAMYPTQPDAPAVTYNGPCMQIIERTFDAANLPATINGVTATAGAADTYRILPIRKGTMVVAVGLEVITTDAGGGTISIGDAGSATQYHNAVATSAAISTASAASTWENYVAANYLLVTINTAALTTAKFRVWALVVNTTASDDNQQVDVAS